MFEFQNFKFLTVLMKIQKSKKITLKLFLKISKHIFLKLFHLNFMTMWLLQSFKKNFKFSSCSDWTKIADVLLFLMAVVPRQESITNH